MAKQYIKPMISFEKLSVASNASGSCEFSSDFAPYVCPLYVPEWGETIFTQESGCDWYGSNGESICYHVPADSSTIFGS